MVEPSDELQAVFDKSINDAKKLRHEYVTLEHLLFAMLCVDNFVKVVEGAGADPEFIKKNIEHYLKTELDEIKVADDIKKFKPKKTATVERVLNRAFTQVLFSGRQHIETTDVFLSIMGEKKSWSYYHIQKSGLTKEGFAEYLNNELDTIYEDEEMRQVAEKALRDFTTNLNKEAGNQKIDPVIGRADELEGIALALGRRSKNNVLLVGDPGVGKTAIAEGL